MNGFGSEGQGGENWKKGEQKAGLNRRIVAATLAIFENERAYSGRGRDAAGAAANRKGQLTQRCSCCGPLANRQPSVRGDAGAKCSYTRTRGRTAAQVRLRAGLAGECRSQIGNWAQGAETSPDLQRKSGGRATHVT